MNERANPPDGPEPVTASDQVRLPQFEGPLDLLLHLVRINEIEITNIPIAEITSQYNAYLDLMRELNLEIAGEYLVMAATLTFIKSRTLLPPDPEAIEQESTTDPRAELTQQLIDYQRFKQAAETLQAMESRRSIIWTRDEVPAAFADEELLAVDVFDLLRAFQKLLQRLGEETRGALRRDTVSVAEKIGWLTDLLRQRQSIGFFEVLTMLPTRLDRIAAFLALLEMIRLQILIAFQRESLGEILLTIVEGPAATGEFDGETVGLAEGPS